MESIKEELKERTSNGDLHHLKELMDIHKVHPDIYVLAQFRYYFYFNLKVPIFFLINVIKKFNQFISLF